MRKQWWLAVLLFGLATFIGAFSWFGELASSARFTEGYTPAYDAWFEFLRKGVDDQDEMARLVRELPRPKGWVATYVSTYPSSMENPSRVLLSEPAHLKTPADLHELLPKAAWTYRRHSYYHGDPARGDLGYALNVIEVVNAAPWAWLAMLGAAAAWLSLAGWVFTDARERQRAAAPVWALLVFLTGPVGMAVWLIARMERWRAPEPAPSPAPCPGCGADTRAEHAFCVRCGHALRPACPDCRRPVEHDWTFCGACGADLGEDRVS